MQILEAVFATTLYLFYLALWSIKKSRQLKTCGINPQVMAKSSSALQQYQARFARLIIFYAVIVILCHSLNISLGSLFSRLALIDFIVFDIIGFITGLGGLSLCLYAQIKMGNSWRLGIDEEVKTELISTGLYKYIRNPTYLGLFLMNIGVWLIWPTWTVFVLNLLFILFLEIQTRCEEDFLCTTHGQSYIEYKSRTKRYIPFIY